MSPRKHKKVYYRRRAFLCPPRAEVDSFIVASVVRRHYKDEDSWLHAELRLAGCSDSIHWDFSDKRWGRKKVARARCILNEFFDAVEAAYADEDTGDD